MKPFILLTLLTIASYGQVKYETQEIIGTVVSIRPGFRFAYEVIELKVNGENFFFGIDPTFGKSILSKIKINQELALKALISKTLRENINERGLDFYSRYYFFFLDKIVEIKMDGVWTTTPSNQKLNVFYNLKRENLKVVLEEPIDEIYIDNGVNVGLFLKGHRVVSPMGFYNQQVNENIKEGDKISFLASIEKVNDQYWYPVEGIREIYFASFLRKTEGKIESFIYKQNYARIGLKINDQQLSFPAYFAKAVAPFANDQSVTIYYEGEKNRTSNLLPTIHAIVQGNDTLKIPFPYYGDPDGTHEFKPAELEGKITKINRTDKGRVISLIVGNDCYVEVEPKMADQLGPMLLKGNHLKITGDERIKRDGEIYEQNYRIITPRKVVADGKEFILKN